MKNTKEWTIIILIVVCLGISTGWILDDNKYNIVDKQDELSITFEEVKNVYNIDVLKYNELGNKIVVMQGLETLSDADLINLEAYQVEYNELLPILNQQAVLMEKIQFTYKILQEMR